MKKKYKKSLVWIRRDLRLQDHTALSAAMKSSQEVAVAFVFDTQILKRLKDKKDRRLVFIFESLREVDENLREMGSQLIVCMGDPIEKIPELIKELGFDALFFNEDYEPYAISRDKKVSKYLKRQSLPCHSFKDQVIHSGEEILKSDKSPYQVFTPYKKAWLKKLKREDFTEQKTGKNYIPLRELKRPLKSFSLKKLGFKDIDFTYDFQKPGRKNALKHLKKFSKNVRSYEKERNFPAMDGTSGLSVHLRFGTISIRECLRLSLKSKSPGHRVWLNELIWRDFYQMILLQFPHVKNKAFKSKYDNLKWTGSEKHFRLWCAGKTGYPIVDAAMRQLNETGWMHNRLRMIVASFLTKDLLIHWQKGEAYFARKLLDYDLAANNGGWQWSASTGCDAQPYFRVFNPELQSRKFDPKGQFLRHWLPELHQCSNKEIHCPENVKNYPYPIVEHKRQKLLAIKMFKASI